MKRNTPEDIFKWALLELKKFGGNAPKIDEFLYRTFIPEVLKIPSNTLGEELYNFLKKWQDMDEEWFKTAERKSDEARAARYSLDKQAAVMLGAYRELFKMLVELRDWLNKNMPAAFPDELQAIILAVVEHETEDFKKELEDLEKDLGEGPNEEDDENK